VTKDWRFTLLCTNLAGQISHLVHLQVSAVTQVM